MIRAPIVMTKRAATEIGPLQLDVMAYGNCPLKFVTRTTLRISAVLRI